MPVVRRETLSEKPDWLKASAFGMFRVPRGGAVELHYHDADEIWFIVEGRARVVSEGREYDLGPGDLLCTGMGDEHGTIEVHEDILGFFLEAELEGEKRKGHLHREEHGVPVPRRRPAGQAAG
jgi:mannose-6-phosphate isomerase-like protein (cupin superfamily)